MINDNLELNGMSGNNNTVIVTGGAGYIGSHVVIKLCKLGYIPVIVDNFTIAHQK